MSPLKYTATLLLLCCLGPVLNAHIIDCYFGIWPSYPYGSPKGHFGPDNIDATLCTHLSFAFFGITDEGEFTFLDNWQEKGWTYINATKELKEVNPKLKIIAAVGGLEEGSVKYSNMGKDANKRKAFISTSVKFMQEYGFHGLDFGWEYPGQRGGLAEDKENLVTLLKEMKEIYSQSDLLVGISVGASREFATTSYDIPKISEYADFINLLTYDMEWMFDGKLGFNGPLRGQGGDNIEESVKFWLENGATASKLIFGVGSYGRTYELADKEKTLPGSPSSGPGSEGPLTRDKGYMGYNEICKILPDWTYVFDDVHGVPYIYKDNQWIDYDNLQSLEAKLDFAKSVGFGGAAISSLETDDFNGECGEKYPLLNAINRKFKSE